MGDCQTTITHFLSASFNIINHKPTFHSTKVLSPLKPEILRKLSLYCPYQDDKAIHYSLFIISYLLIALPINLNSFTLNKINIKKYVKAPIKIDIIRVTACKAFICGNIAPT